MEQPRRRDARLVERGFASALFFGLILLSCRGVPPSAPADELLPRLQDAEKRLAELQNLVVRLKRENLELRLHDARTQPDYAEELRLLLEDALAFPYVEIQIYALNELGGLPDDRRGPRVETAMIGALRHSSPQVRRAAVVALKRTSTPSAIEALHGALQDSDRDVKIAVLEVLGLIKNRLSVPVLIRFVKENADPVLMEKTLDALGNIGDPSAVGVLLAALEEKAPAPVHWTAINSIKKLEVCTDEVKAALRPFLEPGAPAVVKEIAIETLGKCLDEYSLPRFLQFLRDEDPRLRRAVFQALAYMWNEARITHVLVPAFLKERDAEAAKEMWRILNELMEGDFARTVLVGEALLRRDATHAYLDRISEALLEFSELPEPQRNRWAALVERIADLKIEAEEYRVAAPLYGALLQRIPDRWEFYRKSARCHGALKQYETAIKDLSAGLAQASPGTEPWWTLQVERLEVRVLVGDPVALVEDAYPLLAAQAPPEGNWKRRSVQIYDKAASDLLERLRDPDRLEETAAAAIQLGRKILEPVSARLETERSAAVAEALLRIGNVISGTTFDSTATLPDPAKRKATATAWREWLNKP